MRKTRPVAERFWEKVDRRGPDDCWPWTAALDGGYGKFYWNGRLWLAHRAAYELFIGPIPEGKELDHGCHTRDPSCDTRGTNVCFHRRCVNLAHLEPVTPAENQLRGYGFGGVNARKTHCRHGHEFTTENTYLYVKRNGSVRRECRTCWRVPWRTQRASP